MAAVSVNIILTAHNLILHLRFFKLQIMRYKSQIMKFDEYQRLLLPSFIPRGALAERWQPTPWYRPAL